LKRFLLPRIFRLADCATAPSSAGVKFIQSLGIPRDRIRLTPYVVNNDWWLEQVAQVDRTAVREEWEIPVDAPVVLFCAKLQPWKRPHDVLRAFVKAAV